MCVCVCMFMPAVYGPDYRTECDPFEALAAATGTHTQGSFVYTGGVRTIPGAMGPRGSGATTYVLSLPPVVTPQESLEAPGGRPISVLSPSSYT